MDERSIRQRIQNAYPEPVVPRELIQATILRMQAVTMGRIALEQMQTAPADRVGELAARVLVGQLAEMTPLPKDSQPQQLAQQLQQEPAFSAAMRGGNLVQRLLSGEMMRQVAEQGEAMGQTAPQPAAPKKEGPSL